MGFDAFGSDDSTETSTDPSGTHFYFYEEGHERLPENEEVAAAQAEAYDLASTSPDGAVRTLANRGWEGGIAHMMAEFVISLGEMLEEGSPTPVLEWILEDFDEEEKEEAIAQYLDNNPEVGQALAERLQSTEEIAAEN